MLVFSSAETTNSSRAPLVRRAFEEYATGQYTKYPTAGDVPLLHSFVTRPGFGVCGPGEDECLLPKKLRDLFAGNVDVPVYVDTHDDLSQVSDWDFLDGADEQFPNPYITPELCFQFHYFALRKMHFMMRAKAMVAFPGGYGTMDELFEALTLVQTGKIKSLPIILFGREFWQKAIDFEYLRDEGVIAPADLDLFRFVETAAEAWEKIQEYYRRRGVSVPLVRD